MNKTEQGHIQLSHRNKVATIEFFHPSHNSLPGNLLAQLAETITTEGKSDQSIGSTEIFTGVLDVF